MADLRGGTVFLSASFPSDDECGRRFGPFDAAAIADAVTAVTRAVLMSNGRLTFGAHPTISPLVLLVAGEMQRRGEIDIYQSKLFADQIPAETLALVDKGFGHLFMIPADSSGEIDASLRLMRSAMLDRDDLIAGVYIGGMGGIMEEHELLAGRAGIAIVPIRAPGGAARDLQPSDDIAARIGDELDSERYPTLALDVVELLAERLA